MNDFELEIDEETNEFIIKHILKITSDDEAKCAVFQNDNNFVKNEIEAIFKDKDSFIEHTKNISSNLFMILKELNDIPSGDLLICLFNYEYGEAIAILKLDYNKTYIHGIDYVDGKMNISIVPQMIGLPSSTQRIQKAAIINSNFDILIIEKNSKKDENEVLKDYFSQKFIMCQLIKDKRDYTKNILKTSEQWIRKNFREDADKAEKARNVLSKAMKSDDVVNIETLAHYALEKSEELKDEFVKTLKDAGIDKNEVPIDREWVEKKLKRKKLKIDKDIDIYIDSETYNDANRFEIKRNGDGSINIVIKHVRNYIEKQ
ncbi:nucleoid-associated protein [Fervidicella metallireducens]|uniref:nucleoid-associated protein n=1 Tax=Fervidicella metallireducens TaxID=655338 RepID=UPI000687905A|nr:nucleoid-associated protein [Fervidicella metallireducens]